MRAMEDLERVRHLFEDLDTKKDLIQLLGLAERAEGVRIFIGSENKLFSLSGSSLIVAPFQDNARKIVGVDMVGEHIVLGAQHRRALLQPIEGQARLGVNAGCAQDHLRVLELRLYQRHAFY